MKEISKKENFANMIQPLKPGGIVKGKVVGIDRSTILINLGNYGTGIIYGKEFQEARNTLKDLKIGDEMFGKIINLENENGYIELSLKEASKELNWNQLTEKKDKGEVVKVKILTANKGGLLTEVFGISAFLPVSQLSPENYPNIEGSDKNKILNELQKFIGQEMEVKIINIDPGTNKLILSEKQKETKKVEEILEEFKEGDIVDGEITGLVDFGAFIKFSAPSSEKNTIEGLIHISELDWKLISDPGEIVKVGDKVKAKILDISNNKISLSLKALKKDPWEDIEKKYKKNDIIRGKVTRFNFFGAFVEISPSVQGLCHVSEFGTKTEMEKRLKINEEYDFQVSSIEPEDHRIILKLSSK